MLLISFRNVNMASPQRDRGLGNRQMEVKGREEVPQ